jgi:tripartite-type tricarboxylate transporter receptor subunit TctC
MIGVNDWLCRLALGLLCRWLSRTGSPVEFYPLSRSFFASGALRAENANALKDEFNKQSKKGDDWRAIHTGELLKRTAEKKTELGNKIKSSMVANQ